MPRYYKDYPRPQLVRDEASWELLCGQWDFAFDDDNRGETENWYKGFAATHAICVPFACETKSSGIGDTSTHSYVWYQRTVMLDTAKQQDGRVMLHFEGSDYLTSVWLNGALLGHHRGGYTRFSWDATAYVREGENLLVVKVEDSLDEHQVRGKQRWKEQSFGCWYVQTTGIWKPVWLEYLPKRYIDSVKLTPNLDSCELELELEACGMQGQGRLCAEVTFGGVEISEIELTLRDGRLHARIPVYNKDVFEWGVQCWSPQSPNLYDLKLTLLDGDGAMCDTVWSYFGMRSVCIEGQNILLNGTPLYQRLILDQGYWEDSHLTAPNEQALIDDIDKILALGYNGLRKHQKTEDERFLYWCDVKGVLVWCEMPSTYRYSDYAVQNFLSEWIEVVRQHYNHPSVITWTPINESWGIPAVKRDYRQQQFTEAVYHATKALDAMRPVIVNDGWEHTVSDIITLHDYEERGDVFGERYTRFAKEILANERFHCKDRSAFAQGYGYRGQPVMISEFGGIAYNSDDSGWGYGDKVNTEEEFHKRFASITTAVQQLDYCCGYCYTQVTDVQQEINGLMDIHRNYKVDVEKVRAINQQRV